MLRRAMPSRHRNLHPALPWGAAIAGVLLAVLGTAWLGERIGGEQIAGPRSVTELIPDRAPIRRNQPPLFTRQSNPITPEERARREAAFAARGDAFGGEPPPFGRVEETEGQQLQSTAPLSATPAQPADAAQVDVAVPEAPPPATANEPPRGDPRIIDFSGVREEGL